MCTGRFRRTADFPRPFIGTFSALWHHLLGWWLWGERKTWGVHTCHCLLWLGHDRDTEWVTDVYTLAPYFHSLCKVLNTHITFSVFQNPLGVESPHVLSCLRQPICLKSNRCQSSPPSATSTHCPALRLLTPLTASVSLRTNAKADFRSAVSCRGVLLL